MSSATINTAQRALDPRRHRLLAVTLAATVVAAGAGAVASTDLETAGLHTGPTTWSAKPIEFNDPVVVKGARGGDRSPSFYPYFGDPAVRKGAGGR
jgi:hypothetical protein